MASAVDQLLEDLLSSDEDDDNHVASPPAVPERRADATVRAGDAHPPAGCGCCA